MDMEPSAKNAMRLRIVQLHSCCAHMTQTWRITYIGKSDPNIKIYRVISADTYAEAYDLARRFLPISYKVASVMRQHLRVVT